MNIWDLIFGGSKPQVIPAEPLKQYPTPEDAAFAQSAGQGYGDEQAAYLEGLAGKAFGSFRQGKKVDPFVGADISGPINKVWDLPAVNLTGQPGVSQGLEDQIATTFNQAKIASNYVPIAALGLEGRNTTFDASGHEMNVAGLFSPSRDKIMASLQDPSSLLHESIHRGLNMIKGNPAVPPDIASRIENGRQNEYLVRHLMQNYAGDPEQGSVDLQQKAAAAINPPSKDDIDRVNALVAAILAQVHPRGPR